VRIYSAQPKLLFRGNCDSCRDYCVDLVPKFVMADGLLVKILLKMNAQVCFFVWLAHWPRLAKPDIIHSRLALLQDYIDFRLVDGSYVYKKGSDSMFWGKAQLLHKVPATESEALSTGLVSMWGKRGLRNFLVYIKDFDAANQSTWKSFDPKTQTAAELFAKFSLDDDTVDFVGHAMALQDSDTYLTQPAIKLIDAVKLYATSLAAHSKSPYLYPVYGLSGLPEAFSRVCSVRGGIFMLHHDVDEILFADGKVAGVRVGEQAATAPVVISDPSYAPKSRVESSGRIVRTIALLNHPVEQVKTVKSAQIIIPQKQIGRAHDVYMTVLSDQHNVVAKDKFVAICSTVAESSAPKEEVAAGVALLGDMVCRFDNVSETFTAKDDGSADNLFVTSSLDATSHFESVAKEVLSIWKRITGSDFDLAPAVQGAAAAGGQ